MSKKTFDILSALTQDTRSARELVASYASWALGSPVHMYDVVWFDDQWTIDGMDVPEWLEAMTDG